MSAMPVTERLRDMIVFVFSLTRCYEGSQLARYLETTFRYIPANGISATIVHFGIQRRHLLYSRFLCGAICHLFAASFSLH